MRQSDCRVQLREVNCYMIESMHKVVLCHLTKLELGRFSMYRPLEYIIIIHILLSLRCERHTVNMPGEQHKGLCHFNTEKKHREKPSLTCQPTLQYNIIRRKTTPFHDIKMTYCIVRNGTWSKPALMLPKERMGCKWSKGRKNKL